MEQTIPSVFRKFFKSFPVDVTQWNNATDEIRDLTRYIRQYYNEVILDIERDDETHPKSQKALNWRQFKTPSEWNSNGQKEIVRVWNLLDKKHQAEFITDYAKKYFPKWF